MSFKRQLPPGAGSLNSGLRRLPSVTPTGRRLSDKLVVTFNQACDQDELEVANRLLRTLLLMTQRVLPADNDRRKDQEKLVASFERLWMLNHATTPIDKEPIKQPS